MSDMVPCQEHIELTDLLSKMLTLGGLVNIYNDYSIRYASEPDIPITMTLGGDVKKNLYVYSVDIKDPDAIIVNPINDGLTQGKEKLWFYQQLSGTCTIFFKTIITEIINACINDASTESSTDITDHDLVAIVGKYSSEIDTKTLDEFNKICNTAPNELFNIYYDKKNKTAKVLTCFHYEDESFQKSYGNKIRKKTWTLFSNLVKDLFNTEKPLFEVYKSTSISNSYAYFEAYSTVWMRVWKVFALFINKLNIYVGTDTLDQTLDRLTEYLSRLEIYHKKAKWMSQPTAMASSKKSLDMSNIGTNSSRSSDIRDVDSTEPKNALNILFKDRDSGQRYNTDRNTSRLSLRDNDNEPNALDILGINRNRYNDRGGMRLSLADSPRGRGRYDYSDDDRRSSRSYRY